MGKQTDRYLRESYKRIDALGERIDTVGLTWIDKQKKRIDAGEKCKGHIDTPYKVLSALATQPHGFVLGVICKTFQEVTPEISPAQARLTSEFLGDPES